MQFEIYSETARRVIFFARYEASNLGASKIQATHLVLGLLRESKAMFLRLKVPPGKLVLIREACVKAGSGQASISVSVDMPLDKDAVVIIKRASDEMRNRTHKKVDVEHLLLAALHVQSKARSILRRQGLDYEPVSKILFKPRLADSAGDALDYT
ncbi:MAG TPA: Clp protease N-terminal domain-containing protein [Candidatus Angelobacter sp.]|nr:Clp protease N-terminal domain-containing protein [Candidatus Angelobacter sp.]